MQPPSVIRPLAQATGRALPKALDPTGPRRIPGPARSVASPLQQDRGQAQGPATDGSAFAGAASMRNGANVRGGDFLGCQSIGLRGKPSYTHVRVWTTHSSGFVTSEGQVNVPIGRPDIQRGGAVLVHSYSAVAGARCAGRRAQRYITTEHPKKGPNMKSFRQALPK